MLKMILQFFAEDSESTTSKTAYTDPTEGGLLDLTHDRYDDETDFYDSLYDEEEDVSSLSDAEIDDIIGEFSDIDSDMLSDKDKERLAKAKAEKAKREKEAVDAKKKEADKAISNKNVDYDESADESDQLVIEPESYAKPEPLSDTNAWDNDSNTDKINVWDNSDNLSSKETDVPLAPTLQYPEEIAPKGSAPFFEPSSNSNGVLYLPEPDYSQSRNNDQIDDINDNITDIGEDSGFIHTHILAQEGNTFITDIAGNMTAVASTDEIFDSRTESNVSNPDFIASNSAYIENPYNDANASVSDSIMGNATNLVNIIGSENITDEQKANMSESELTALEKVESARVALADSYSAEDAVKSEHKINDSVSISSLTDATERNRLEAEYVASTRELQYVSEECRSEIFSEKRLNDVLAGSVLSDGVFNPIHHDYFDDVRAEASNIRNFIAEYNATLQQKKEELDAARQSLSNTSSSAEDYAFKAEKIQKLESDFEKYKSEHNDALSAQYENYKEHISAAVSRMKTDISMLGLYETNKSSIKDNGVHYSDADKYDQNNFEASANLAKMQTDFNVNQLNKRYAATKEITDSIISAQAHGLLENSDFANAQIHGLIPDSTKSIQKQVMQDLSDEIKNAEAQQNGIKNCLKSYAELKSKSNFDFNSSEAKAIRNQFNNVTGDVLSKIDESKSTSGIMNSGMRVTASSNDKNAARSREDDTAKNGKTGSDATREEDRKFKQKEAGQVFKSATWVTEGFGNTAMRVTEKVAGVDENNASQGANDVINKAREISNFVLGGSISQSQYRHIIDMQASHMNKIGANAEKCSKYINETPGSLLTLDSFNNKKELKEALKSTDLSQREQRIILKNRTAIGREISGNAYLQSLANSLEFQKNFNATSKNFLNNAVYTKNGAALYANALNTSLNVTTAGNTKFDVNKLSKRQLKMIANGKDIKGRFNVNISKSGVSVKRATISLEKGQRDAILSLRRNNGIFGTIGRLDAENAKRNLKRAKMGATKSRMRMLSSKATNMFLKNDTLSSANKTWRVTSRMLKVTATVSFFIVRHTMLYKAISNQMRVLSSHMQQQVKKMTHAMAQNTIASAKRAKSTAVNKVQKTLSVTRNRIGGTVAGKSINKAVSEFGQTKVGQGVNKVANGMKKAKDGVREGTKKLARGAKKTGKVVGAGGKKAAKIVASPFKFVTKFFDVLRLFKKWLLIILGIIFLIYISLLALIYLPRAVSSTLENTQSGVMQAISEVENPYRKYILYDDLSKMKPDVQWILDRDKEIYAEAEEFGQGHPLNDEVLEGHHIDKYGSPDKEKGYTITYYDAYGNELSNQTTNAKDIMALCTAMMSNQIGFSDNMSEGDRKDYKAMDKLIKEMYDLMLYKEPGTDLPFKVVESDIYTCDHGCDIFKYHCNNMMYDDGTTDYSTYRQFKRDGVGFYYTESEIYNMMKSAKSHTASEYCTTHGIDSTEKFRYRIDPDNRKGCRERVIPDGQVRVYINYSTGTYRSKNADSYDESCAETYGYYDYYYEYLPKWLDGYYDSRNNWHEPKFYEAYVDKYLVQYYCDGDHEMPVCYGHKDVDLQITLFDAEYAFNNDIYPVDLVNGSCAECTKNWLNHGRWAPDGVQEDVRNYKSGDWYHLYDILIEGAEFSTTSSMPPDEINNIVNGYGDEVASVRRDIIKFGLNKVGKIHYEYGGKPHGYGNNVPLGTPTGDDKGRKNGLDCSGFINYIIGSTTGKNVPIGTAYYSRYPMKNESNLEIGDVGFIKKPGSADNHIAMYIGDNEAGQRMWLECNGSQGACVTTSTAYRYFMDPLSTV